MSAKIQTSLRLDAEKLAEAKQILAELGMNFSEAVNIFTSMIVAKHGLPFNVVLPSEETKAAMQDVRAGQNLETVTEETEDVLRYMAGKRLAGMLKDAKPNDAALSLTQEDVNRLIHECFSYYHCF